MIEAEINHEGKRACKETTKQAERQERTWPTPRNGIPVDLPPVDGIGNKNSFSRRSKPHREITVFYPGIPFSVEVEKN